MGRMAAKTNPFESEKHTTTASLVGTEKAARAGCANQPVRANGGVIALSELISYFLNSFTVIKLLTSINMAASIC